MADRQLRDKYPSFLRCDWNEADVLSAASSRFPAKLNPAAHWEMASLRHSVLDTFRPASLSVFPAKFPGVTSQMNSLQSVLVSGSASGGAQTKTTSQVYGHRPQAPGPQDFPLRPKLHRGTGASSKTEGGGAVQAPVGTSGVGKTEPRPPAEDRRGTGSRLPRLHWAGLLPLSFRRCGHRSKEAKRLLWPHGRKGLRQGSHPGTAPAGPELFPTHILRPDPVAFPGRKGRVGGSDPSSGCFPCLAGAQCGSDSLGWTLGPRRHSLEIQMQGLPPDQMDRNLCGWVWGMIQ